MIKVSKQVSAVLFTILSGWILFIIIKMPEYANIRDYVNYGILLIANVLVFMHFICVICNRGIDIFEPWSYFFILNVALFVVYPLVMIWDNNTLCGKQFDVMGGCFWGTIVFLIAYFSFSYFYFLNSNGLNDINSTTDEIIVSESNFDYKKLVMVCYVGWLVCFILSVISMMVYGRSFMYIITLGSQGPAMTDTFMTDSPLKFLTNFQFSMLGFALYIVLYSKNIIGKIAITYLSLSIYIVWGFRFIILGLIIAYLATYYIYKRKRPTLQFVVVAIVFAIFISTFVGMQRGTMRVGEGMISDAMEADDIEFMFYSNLNIYQTYYGVMDKVPLEQPHTFGKATIFDPLITFIPRAIWSGKPLANEGANLSALRSCIDPVIVDHYAMATPYLTEIYLDYTVIGVFFIMSILGKSFASFYENALRRDKAYLIRYAIFLGFFMQLIIRGYFANGLWMLVFAYLPSILIEKTSICS